MASIDERIVSMVFENAKFEAAVAQTMQTLQKLNENLAKVGKGANFSDLDKQAAKVKFSQPMSALDKFKSSLGNIGSTAGTGFSRIEQAGSRLTLRTPLGALRGIQSAVAGVGRSAPSSFTQIEKSADNVQLGGLSRAVDGISSKFSVLRGAAAVALGGIAAQAAMTGAEVVKSLTLGPILDGFHNYETQINAVQTIMANTGMTGKAGIDQVNAALKDLNHYANLTVYNFSEMVRNIGTFTAAGVDLKTATGAIKGIANLAAMSGSTSMQAASAMYQLSQAIAAGQVKLQDWNSVVNAGIGGTVFQRALAQTAEAMGTLQKGAVQLVGPMRNVMINGESFRQSMQIKGGAPSWLTSKVLVNTLQEFTGDLTDAQLKAQGFSDSQIKAMQAQAKVAVAAATNIKTLSQLMQALKEEVATAWAAIFKSIFGNLAQATTVFSKVHTAVENFLTNPLYAFNNVLMQWQKMGGRNALIEGLHQGIQDLGRVLKPVQQAFRDIFPPTTAKDLLDLTNGFKNLMDRLKASSATMENIRRTFRGLFAVLDIAKTIFVDLIKTIASLFGAAGKGAGGILNFTGSIGDFLVSVDRALNKGKALEGFFGAIGAILKVPIRLIEALANALFGLFGGKGTDKVDAAKQAFNGLGGSLDGLKSHFEPVIKIADKFINMMDKVVNKVKPVVREIATEVGNIVSGVGQALQHANFNTISAALSTGVMGGIFVTLRKGLGSIKFNVINADLKSLNTMFSALTGNLKAMQKNVQANTMLQIAAAIGILAAGVYALSTIDPKRLVTAMTGISVGLGELVGAMKLMTSGVGKLGFIQMPVISASLIGLATAVTILAAAMKIFSTLSWSGLAKGFAGLAGSLLAVGLGVKAIGPSVLLVGPGLIAVGLAMTILAEAMKMFGALKWDEMIKGLAGIAGSLIALGAGMAAIGPEVTLVAPGLLLASFALVALAGAVRAFSDIPLKNMIVGILGIGGAIAMLGYAIETIPPTIVLQAAGLLVMSAALAGLAGAIALMGRLNLGTLLKGILGIGGALAVLALGLTAMSGTALGAVALVAAAAGLALLAPALGFLGTLNWGTIGKGLVAIVALLGTLALAGTVAAGPISALGLALLPLAGFFIASAAAAWLLAKALVVIGGAGSKGIGVMIAAITAFVALLPKIIINFVEGLVNIADEIAKVAPRVAAALAKILDVILNTVIKEAPKLAAAITVLVGQFLHVIDVNAPKIVTSGLKLIVSLLTGIAKNIGRVTAQAAIIIANFLTALSHQLPKIVTAGVGLILSFIGGVANNYKRIISTAITVVGKFVGGVAGELPRLITEGAKAMARFVSGIVTGFAKAFVAGVNAVLHLLSGIASTIGKIVEAAVHIASQFISHLASGLVRLADVGATAIINFLNGMAGVIRKRAPQIRQAGWNIVGALVDGILGGISDLWNKVEDKLSGLAKKIPGPIRKILKILSPSQVMHEIGTYISMGLANGIEESGIHVVAASEDLGKKVHETMKKSMKNVPGLLDGIDKNPKITPVLDLSHVKKNAKQLSELTKTTPISVSASLGQAGAISREKAASDKVRAEAVAGATKPSVKFEQTINSPEPLSTLEIYRRTNSQVSKIRKAVGIE